MTKYFDYHRNSFQNGKEPTIVVSGKKCVFSTSHFLLDSNEKNTRRNEIIHVYSTTLPN